MLKATSLITASLYLKINFSYLIASFISISYGVNSLTTSSSCLPPFLTAAFLSSFFAPFAPFFALSSYSSSPAKILKAYSNSFSNLGKDSFSSREIVASTLISPLNNSCYYSGRSSFPI